MRIYRKVTNEDLFGKSTNTVNFKHVKHVKKVFIPKKQAEYGPKKRIKP